MSPFIDQADRLTSISDKSPTQGSLLAYAAVENALSESGMLTAYEYQIFRTGSERNQTNITDSDVDFLIGIPDVDSNRFEHWSGFNRLVHDILSDAFEGKFSQANKCLKAEGIPELPSIDIVPCLVRGVSGLPTDDGEVELPEVIKFWTSHDDPEQIISYPNAHLRNGNSKDKRTDGEYKRVVRTLKAQKSDLVETGEIDVADVSSYHLECLLHNIPDKVFATGPDETIQVAIGQITSPSYSELLTVNQRYDLFGGGTLHWLPDSAQRFALAHRLV